MVRLSQIFSNIEKAKTTHEFLPTGFRSVDQALDGGLMRKELVLLGAGTGIGKSYIAGQIMYSIARKGFKTAYFSLEISNEMVASRLLGAIANLKPNRLMVGLLDQEEHKLRLHAKSRLQAYEDLMSFYDDLYKMEQIVKAIRENEYDFVVIDFLQNILHPARDEYSRLSAIAVELQQLAKEKNCCILGLSQLSNAVNREHGKILEYKGSGSLATVADLGFFLERSEIEEGINAQKVTLSLKKNRRGISGQVFEMYFKIPGGQLYEA